MIILIVGIAENNVIGNKGQLPWRISEDLKLFKQFTENNVVIMGRKTWDSIPEKFKPLPNRVNIVVSRSVQELEGATVYNSIETALEEAKKTEKDIFFIGGSGIYKEGMQYCDHLYISHITGEYEGDTYFPEIEKELWEVHEEQPFEQFTFRKYKRRS